MRLDSPNAAREGDFTVYGYVHFGRPWASIELSKGGSVLSDISEDDADRLIRALCAAKDAMAAECGKAASPHKYHKIAGKCYTCGKPEGDELHAEPKPKLYEYCDVEPATEGKYCEACAPAVALAAAADPYDRAIQQAEFFAQPGNTVDDMLAAQAAGQ